MCGKSKTLPFHAVTACKWSGGMAPLVLNFGLWSASRLGGFTPGERTPVLTEYEAGWEAGSVWTALEKMFCLCRDSNIERVNLGISPHQTSRLVLGPIQRLNECAPERLSV
jgi:hypothetical protein